MKHLAIGLFITIALIACGSGGSNVTDPPLGTITVTLEVTPAVTITSAGAVTLLATTSSNVGSVEFYSGATVLATDNSAPFSHSLNVSSGDNGTLVLSAKAFAGTASRVSANVSRTVNIVAAPANPFNVRVTGRGTFIEYDIAVDGSDRPAMLYRLTDPVDAANSGTFVSLWTGSAWQTTANILAAPEAFFTPIALKFVGGKPTVFGTTTRNTTVRPIIPAGIVVRQWNGSSWAALGALSRPADFSPDSDWQLLAVLQQTDGVPVLAAQGFTTAGKTVLQAVRLTGSSWVIGSQATSGGTKQDFFLSDNALAYLQPGSSAGTVEARVQNNSQVSRLTQPVTSAATTLVNAGVNGLRPVIQTFTRPTPTTSSFTYRRWNPTTDTWDDLGKANNQTTYSPVPRHPFLTIEPNRFNTLVKIDDTRTVVRELTDRQDSFNALKATSDSSGAIIAFSSQDGGLGVARIAP